MDVRPVKPNSFRDTWPYFLVSSEEVNVVRQECSCWNDHWRSVQGFPNAKCSHLRALNFWLKNNWREVFADEVSYHRVCSFIRPWDIRE